MIFTPLVDPNRPYCLFDWNMLDLLSCEIKELMQIVNKFLPILSPLTYPLEMALTILGYSNIYSIIGGDNCIKVYPRRQIVKMHLHLNTL